MRGKTTRTNALSSSFFKGLLAVVMLLAWGLGAVSAEAMPIEYRFSGLADGAFYTDPAMPTDFTDNPFVISFKTDTSAIDFSIPDTAFISGLNGTVSLIGLGNFTFAGLLTLYSIIPEGTIGVADESTQTDLFAMPAVAPGYDLSTYFTSPITDVVNWSFADISMNDGFFLTLEAYDVTFSAVPEPSSVLLLGGGALGLLFFGRKLRRQHNP